MSWVLIVSWLSISQSYQRDDRLWHEVAMQEFSSKAACQFASVEAQKIAPGIRVVCVPKGDPK